uniref:hypothetical protein n=1 Tax=Pedobacter schmidteae TaxID=2201271 RepID=UPI000EB29699|nr:hypothetical protein [Pedobacter schmidteae]
MNAIEKELNPLQSLKIISEVILHTKDELKNYSFLYLIWGWVIALASFSFFALHTLTSSSLFFLPFPVLVVAGIVVTFFHYRSASKTSETYLAGYLKNLWMVLGICFVLTIFISLSQQLQPFTYTLLIGGVGTLVSGLNLRFKPLIIGGIVFFIAAVASVFITEQYRPLIHGIAVIIGYLIPGYLLKYSKS